MQENAQTRDGQNQGSGYEQQDIPDNEHSVAPFPRFYHTP